MRGVSPFNVVVGRDQQKSGTIPIKGPKLSHSVRFGLQPRRKPKESTAAAHMLRPLEDRFRQNMKVRDAQHWVQNLPRRLMSMCVPIKIHKPPTKVESSPETQSRTIMATPDLSLDNSPEIPQRGFEMMPRGTINAPVAPHDDHTSTQRLDPDRQNVSDESNFQSEGHQVDSGKGRPITPIQQPSATLPFLPTGPGPGKKSTTSESKSPVIDPQASLVQRDSLQNPDWSRIQRLRKEIWSQRSRLQECRSELRDKRQLKASADDKYIQYVRSHGHGIRFGNQPLLDEQTEINQLFQACETARQEYGPMEDDCDTLEINLTVLEYELDRLETRYQERSTTHRPSLTANYDSTHHANIVPSSVSSDSGSEQARDYHPLVSEYLSKLGDVDIYKERLDELLEERYILEEDREKRARVGLRLSEENEQWLADYSRVEAGLIEQFESAQKEAEKLKQQCLLQNLVNKDGEPTDQEYQETRAFVKDLNDDGAGEVSEYVKHPTLLPSPGAKLPMEVPSSVLFGDDVEHIPPVRVNSWILEQVRRSALEVELLARTHDTQHDQISSREEWQSDVLQIWYKDRALDDWLSARPSSPIRTMAPLSAGCPSSTSAEDSPIGIWNQVSQILHPQESIPEDGSISSRQSSPVLHAPRPIQLVEED